MKPFYPFFQFFYRRATTRPDILVLVRIFKSYLLRRRTDHVEWHHANACLYPMTPGAFADGRR